MNRADFPFTEAGSITTQLIEQAYTQIRFRPAAEPVLAPLPLEPQGLAGFASALQDMVDGSAGLASPMMLGHMDTAPHPVAAFADAVVAALNNNLLFRELSPFASQVEEHLLASLADHMGLVSDWHGTFVSGGSLANLTALFAACGGYGEVALRQHCEFFVPECAHNSVARALAVMGVNPAQIHLMQSDSVGRTDVASLETALDASTAKRKVVVAVLGSTLHGAVEDIAALAGITQAAGAWLHVDAVYGGALAFSHQYKSLLAGLDLADSVVTGPQKWLFVPRLCAVVYIRGKQRFDASLSNANNYSSVELPHRGQWGLQGSRRADAMTLWVVLRALGTNQLGTEIDQSIELARAFHQALATHSLLKPLHVPDLNLQCFTFRDELLASDDNGLHSRSEQLGYRGLPWVGVASWRGRGMFRSVLLAPEAKLADLHSMLDGICD